MTIKLVQLGGDGMACEGGVCAIPESAVKAGSATADAGVAKAAPVKPAEQSAVQDAPANKVDAR
jgi:hypothetical protein